MPGITKDTQLESWSMGKSITATLVGLVVKDGLFRRQERVALMSAGLLLNGLTVVIWPMAILSNVTALQRFWIVAKGLRELDRLDATAKPD